MIERAIVEAAARLRRAGEPFVVATIVGQRGSTYRRAGARLLLAGDHRVAGEISGGCVEGDLARRGWWRLRGHDAAVVTYDSRHDDGADDDEVRAAFAVGCNGVIDVLLEHGVARVGRIDPLVFAERCMQAQRVGAIATIYRATGAGADASAMVGARFAIVNDGSTSMVDANFSADAGVRAAVITALSAAIATRTSSHHVLATRDGELAVFVEALVPPPRLFVFGTGPDAVPVVELARSLGWGAIACTPRMRPSIRERFVNADDVLTGAPVELARHLDAADRALAVVMAHDYELDRAHLDALLATRAHYIGVLGPRARTNRMLADVGRDHAGRDPRLHAPIGLELGAERPREIALAIAAELQAVIAGVPHRSLRDHHGPIHSMHAVAVGA